ncbi:MAG: hypothetical protein IPJ65_41885 [Archangiaceae bacterium]|nr:hypothetical protein [Archangiaceae bacterium]
MRKAWLTVGLLACACAHEKASAAMALGCSDEQTEVVASGEARTYLRPVKTQASQAAISGAAAAIGALSSLVGAGNGSAAYYLPAGATQLGAPGWREYAGCGKGLLCFDGGFCLEVEDGKAARRVPALMEKSLAELGGRLEPETECREPRAYAERRGAVYWALSRCAASLGCRVAEGGYTCTDGKGRAVRVDDGR